MNEDDASATALAESESAPANGGAPSPLPAEPSGWTGGRIAAVVCGTLLGLVGLGLFAGGGTAVWAEFQRDAGYVTTSVHDFSTGGSALATKPVELGSSAVRWLFSSPLLDKVRIRVTPVSDVRPVFVGIGASTAVDGYLSAVQHTVITDFWGNDVQAVPGGASATPPGRESFWVASTTGRGPRTLVWKPSGGTWTVVVMNASGRPGLDVSADLGFRVSALRWIAVALFSSGAILIAAGALLVFVAIRRSLRPA